MAPGESLEAQAESDSLAALQLVDAIVLELGSGLPLHEILGRLLERVLQHLGSPAGWVAVHAPDGQPRVAATRGLPEPELREGELDPGPSASLLSAAIRVGDELRGAIRVKRSSSRPAFTAGEQRLVETLARHAALALATARHAEELLQRAQRDALTGLANHGYFWSSLALELERADRYQRELSLVMIDIDRFKAFNDRYGHIAGDEALAAVARLIAESCRSSDLAARYGGEEFAVILPETSIEGARAFGEKIRQGVEAERLAADGSRRLTASVGAGAFPKDARSARDLVETADRALYRAKSAGRNRVADSS